MSVGDEGAIICIISTIPTAAPDRPGNSGTKSALVKGFLRKIQRRGDPSQAAPEASGLALLACGAACIKICNMACQGESHGVCKASRTEREGVCVRAMPRRLEKASLPGLLQLPAVQRRSLQPLPFGRFQAGPKRGRKPFGRKGGAEWLIFGSQARSPSCSG